MMRILLAALAIAAFSMFGIIEASGWETLLGLNFSGKPELLNLFVLLLLSIVLLVEALWAVFGPGRRKGSGKAEEEETLVAQSRVETAKSSGLQALETELAKASQLVSRLQAGAKEKEEKLLELEAELEACRRNEKKLRTAAGRDDRVNAEIVQFLSLLQKKGRFVDFLMEDITPYGDEQVGAAARVVHQGCRRILEECFAVKSIYEGSEGEGLSLSEGYDPVRYRLLGDVAEKPPYQGHVVHRGWMTEKVELPRAVEGEVRSEQLTVISPVEVEIRR